MIFRWRESQEWCRKYAMDKWAYCLMQNHIHLIAVPGRKENLILDEDFLSLEILRNDLLTDLMFFVTKTVWTV